MDVIISRLESETEVTQTSKKSTDHMLEKEHEPPIINLLNMTPPSMPKMTKGESLPPNMLITSLFFLWGFTYGLVIVLNTRFGAVAQLSPLAARGLHAAYHGGYLIGGIVLGRVFLKYLGFAGSLIAGLYIHACGALLFWPSAVLGSTLTFVLSNALVAFGLSVLETTSNLFVAICGPLEYAEIRLCFAQSFEAIGNVFGTVRNLLTGPCSRIPTTLQI